jgi:hypothetical protein
VNSSLSCSITKSLIYFDKWATNENLSPILKSPWTCKPSWLTWFHWMKHNTNTYLNKYNVLMVNSTLHLFLIEPPHFFLESCVPLWSIPNGITFPLMSNYFGATLWFCVISFKTFVRSLGPYWHWYLQTTNQPILCYLWTYIALQNKQLVTYFMFIE